MREDTVEKEDRGVFRLFVSVFEFVLTLSLKTKGSPRSSQRETKGPNVLGDLVSWKGTKMSNSSEISDVRCTSRKNDGSFFWSGTEVDL